MKITAARPMLRSATVMNTMAATMPMKITADQLDASMKRSIQLRDKHVPQRQISGRCEPFVAAAAASALAAASAILPASPTRARCTWRRRL
jgi:hypothetical protein